MNQIPSPLRLEDMRALLLTEQEIKIQKKL